MKSVYTDTSVVGGCFDNEFKEHSLALFGEFKRGKKRLMYSDMLEIELEAARQEVRNQMKKVPLIFKTRVKTTLKAADLSNVYIKEVVLSNNDENDALHIALATLHSADVLASWNFKHIVNQNKIKLYNSINQRMGYRMIEIRTPREILNSTFYGSNQRL